jgi:hypothetical protein
MFKTPTFKDLIEQQYDLQKRGAEIADKTASAFVNALPKFPTPAEIIDSAMEMNKFWSKTVQDELTNTAKKFYSFK